MLRVDPQQTVMVGRNMDWLFEEPVQLRIYPRGIHRTGLTSTHRLEWTSRYGSLVAVSQDVALEGMNEKGLAAHMLILRESNYGVRDERLPAMSVLMWLQYYLDHFQTVADAVQFTESKPFQLIPFFELTSQKWFNLHLALEDPTGDTAIIEYIAGKPIIYHHRDYKVLTNSPTYDQHLSNLKQFQGFGGEKPLPGTTDTRDRFVRASYYIDHLPTPSTETEALSQLKSVLANVASPQELILPEQGVQSHTIWSSISDLTHRRYYFKTLSALNMIWVAMDKFSFEQNAEVMALDVMSSPELTGEVSARFSVWIDLEREVQ